MARKIRQPWDEMPFLRILPVFIGGLVVGELKLISGTSLIILIATSIIVLLLMQFVSSWWSWRFRFVRGIAVQLIIFCLGPLVLFINRKSERSPSTLPEGYYRYILLEPVTEKPRSLRATASVDFIVSGSYHPLGKAILYFPKSFQKDKLKYGSEIICNSKPGLVSSIINPGAFNYRAYLATNGIGYQCFITDKNAILTNCFNGNVIYRWIFNIRDFLLSVLKKYIPDPASSGLAEALLTGYRNDVDDEMLQAYVNTGVVHVIAISGLHLGLIYLILAKISSVIFRGKSRHILQPLVVISSLWIFTLLSGASASVVRSAVMFSLFAIGNLIGRKSTPMNTLAASAFLLLAFQPHWLSDIGFQLSYTAVAGILLLHKKLSNAYPFTNFFARKLWETICLTLSAQILTTPLLLLYFHRFPLLFLFTNLIAVPLSSVILFAELFLCVFSFFSFIAVKTGIITDNLIRLMNRYVLTMDTIPNSNIENVFITPLQTLILYIFILFIILINRGNFKKIVAACILMLIPMFAELAFLKFRIKKQNEFLVLHTPRKTVIGIVRQSNLQILSSDSGLNKKELNQLLVPLMYTYRIKNTEFKKIPDGPLVRIEISGLTVLRFNKIKALGYTYPTNLNSLVIVSGNCPVSIEEIWKNTNCNIIVADASNTVWKIQQWKKEAEQLHLRFHSVPEQGAFLANRDQLLSPD